MRWIAWCLPLFLLSACGGDDFADLKKYMDEVGRAQQPPLDPLPVIKPYETLLYEPADLPDPFRPRSMKSSKAGGLQPDLNRPKVYLERFPLDSLQMIGTLDMKGQLAALVRTPESQIQVVRKGDFIGQNNGVVLKVRESGLDIKEIVQDGNGDWVEANAAISLKE